ncbi:hypothetical protein RRG08_055023 [Elysia crispata]|uniref:Uncharacterized protein n=1 Tax=Elysia crispata TaxID=231223 RepID=A0AAE1CLK8_9GAST|nr:hypothetical protein RRG08_055023 [Elysia crispata]
MHFVKALVLVEENEERNKALRHKDQVSSPSFDCRPDRCMVWDRWAGPECKPSNLEIDVWSGTDGLVLSANRLISRCVCVEWDRWAGPKCKPSNLEMCVCGVGQMDWS